MVPVLPFCCLDPDSGLCLALVGKVLDQLPACLGQEPKSNFSSSPSGLPFV